jgi:uncharacterized protein YndB with AHSA1/START domain
MSSLTLRRRIAARAPLVFDALTTPDGIAHWWGPDAGPVILAETDVRVGGRFRVRFRMLDGGEHESAGEYLVVDRPHRLAMSWRWISGGGASNSSRIDVELKPIGEGVELVFTHSGLPDEESARSHEQGWSGALDKMERYFLEGAKACRGRSQSHDQT